MGRLAAALTMIGEGAGYSFLTPVNGMQVFAANFTFAAGLRPGWIVLLFCLAVAGAAVIWLRPAMSARRLSRTTIH